MSNEELNKDLKQNPKKLEQLIKKELTESGIVSDENCEKSNEQILNKNRNELTVSENETIITKLIETAKRDGVKFIEPWFSDMYGKLKSVDLPIERFGELLRDGLWFDGSSIKGFARIEESDMYLKGLSETYAILPWTKENKKTARVVCEIFTPEGDKYESCPRRVLERAVFEAKKMGYDFFVGPEPEFFIFKKGKLPIVVTEDGYFDASVSEKLSNFRKDVMIAFQSFGIKAELGHEEVAPSQHEINFEYSDALSCADNVMTMKHIVKKIADKYELKASFMPKPLPGENGSGMHCHFSLFKDGKPVFYDPLGEYNLSNEAKWFIGGILNHIKEASAILSPTVNSYKRLVPGYEAPVYISWGQNNRSALIRVPRLKKGKPAGVRAELRCPDPSGSPYLTFAVMLQMGLKGIQEKINPGLAVEGNLYEIIKGKEALPDSLGSAILELEQSELMKKALGPAFKPYVLAKRKEWDEFRTAVTDWEIKKYYSQI